MVSTDPPDSMVDPAAEQALRLGEEAFVNRSFAVAESQFLKVLSVLEAQNTPSAALARVLNNLGATYRETQRFEESEAYLKRALVVFEKTLGKTHPEYALTQNNLGLLYDLQSRFDKAEPLYDAALSLRKQLLEPDDPDIVESLHNLGLVRLKQRKHQSARTLLEESVRLMKADHPTYASTLSSLGLLHYQASELEQAEACYQQALEAREQRLGKSSPELVPLLNNLGTLYLERQNYLAAETCYKRALAILDRFPAGNPAWVSTTLNNLLLLYRKTRRTLEAEAIEERLSAMAPPVFPKLLRLLKPQEWGRALLRWLRRKSL
jgi:tetratricopeptide (TPR) repeat protein